MAEEKKKKPLVHEHITKSTKDLISIIEKWHANTPDAARRRTEGIENEMQDHIQDFEDAQRAYLKSVNDGKQTRMIKQKNAYQHASELLNKILLEGVKKEYGADAAKVYEKNPNMLKDYAAGRGIRWESTRDDMITNRKSLHKSKAYNNLKQTLAQYAIKDFGAVNNAKQELALNRSHHKAVRDQAKKAGLNLDETLEIPDVIKHYGANVEQAINSEYLVTHEDDVKGYKPPKKDK